jgi:hypothetical protein
MTSEQSSPFLAEYAKYLAGKSPRTVEAYLRVLRQLLPAAASLAAGNGAADDCAMLVHPPR